MNEFSLQPMVSFPNARKLISYLVPAKLYPLEKGWVDKNAVAIVAKFVAV